MLELVLTILFTVRQLSPVVNLRGHQKISVGGERENKTAAIHIYIHVWDFYLIFALWKYSTSLGLEQLFI